jgi:hypothetical protein
MDIGAPFVANSEATELMKPGEGALHDPTMLPQTAAVFRSSLGQMRTDLSSLERLAMRFGVVCTVGIDALGTTPGTTDATPNGLDPVDQGEQLSHVVTVSPGEDGVQRCH